MATACNVNSAARGPPATSRGIYNHAVAQGETILDTVHGRISVHPLIWKMINTPQFQRLRYIRMLGPSYFVYPTGNHTRFEHCIGVSYLAVKMVEYLRENQPELKITDQDCLSIAVAALSHDLGHGPLSHTFERFMGETRPDSHWEHEDVSVTMMRWLIEENHMMPEFERYGMAEIDLMFVEELIHGRPGPGRPTKEKRFLFEIVANKRNGIDVDRIDYIMRDVFNVPVVGCPDFKPLFHNVRACLVGGEWQLSYAEDVAELIFALFNTRRELHLRLYQDLPNGLAERMVLDAMVAADPHLPLVDSHEKVFHMSESVDDLKRFLLMGDEIVPRISQSGQPEMKTAKDIMQRIHTGDLYTFIGCTEHVPQPRNFDLNQLRMELASTVTAEVGRDIRVTDVVVIPRKFDYGMGGRNPMDLVWFHNRSQPTLLRKISAAEFSSIHPTHWLEQAVVVFYKHGDADVVNALKYALGQWAGERDLSVQF